MKIFTSVPISAHSDAVHLRDSNLPRDIFPQLLASLEDGRVLLLPWNERCDALAQCLSRPSDVPVFVFPADIEQIEGTKPPRDFIREVDQAVASKNIAKLILMGLEVQGARWELVGLIRLAQALKSLNQPQKVATPKRTILFTGHRIDSRSRKSTRFPPEMENVARNAISLALVEQQKLTRGPILGIAGGANGGDILFHEVCQELTIPTELLLALPKDEFAQAGVANDDPGWIDRFQEQIRLHPAYEVLGAPPELPTWLNFKDGYDIWQRNNLWLAAKAISHGTEHRTLLALWDGEAGDAPGGTEDMVNIARAFNSQFVWLRTKDLFGLATRSV